MEECEEWLRHAMTMPVRTDDEALLFLEAAGYVSHHSTLAVMARYRRIAIDETLPRAAVRVVSTLGDTIRLWSDPRGQDIGQVVVIDVLQSQHDDRWVKLRASEMVGRLREYSFHVRPGARDFQRLRLPEPASAIVALFDDGRDSAAFRAMDDPPESASAPEFQARLERLREAARAEAPRLQAMREELERLAGERP